MDIARLKDAAKVRLVRFALAQTFERRFLVAEGLQEQIRKLGSVEGRSRQGRNGFFDFDGVHPPQPCPAIRASITPTAPVASTKNLVSMPPEPPGGVSRCP